MSTLLHAMPCRLLAAAVLALPVLTGPAVGDAAQLDLREGDRIVFVGNTFAERMRHFGHFEAALSARYPELELTFRNLGWSADEVGLQPRPMDFGDMDTHLAEQQASVIFLCFGFNESFQGVEALDGFLDEYARLIEHLAANSYDGHEPARPVVVGPMKPEPLPHGLRTPDYADLAVYAEAIRELADELGVPHIDLHESLPDVREAYGIEDGERTTFNGIHLTEFGDHFIAHALSHGLGLQSRPHALMADAAANRAENFFLGVVENLALTAEGGTLDLRWDRLPMPRPPGDAPQAGGEWMQVRIGGLAPGSYRLHWDGAHAAEYTADELAQGIRLPMTPAHEAAEALRQVVIDKSELFFDRWRAVNGFYIYGGRKQPFGVVSFPPEMNRFDELVLEREQEIQERVTTPVRATLTIEALAR